ncbi:uncharacterized protein LOC114721247 [Neltuma alba]|uniref:uncharacterized protein LOC114721247 n=1 Tax=Neltuma alba TaxID=207710 RepID=UPI0010A38F1F|nr:uncharacterized protein LOC114721247 [Prosopis alba]
MVDQRNYREGGRPRKTRGSEEEEVNRRAFSLHATGDLDQDWDSWIDINIKNVKRSQEEWTWPDTLAVTCWFIWKWRNLQIHSPDVELPVNRIQRIFGFLDTYNHGRCFDALQDTKEETTLVTWAPPPKSWCKLNSDGTVSTDGLAGCGGVLPYIWDNTTW